MAAIRFRRWCVRNFDDLLPLRRISATATAAAASGGRDSGSSAGQWPFRTGAGDFGTDIKIRPKLEGRVSV